MRPHFAAADHALGPVLATIGEIGAGAAEPARLRN
jgi:hypothetical protein